MRGGAVERTSPVRTLDEICGVRIVVASLPSVRALRCSCTRYIGVLHYLAHCAASPVASCLTGVEYNGDTYVARSVRVVLFRV